MPRTKLNNKKVTNKRNRNSTVEESRANAMGDIDRGELEVVVIFLDDRKSNRKKNRFFKFGVREKLISSIFFVWSFTEMEAILTDFTFKQEQKRDQIRNHINNIRSKMPANILTMKMGYLKELLEQSVCTYDQVQEQVNANMGVLANITNQTINTMNITASAKVSRTDDGKMNKPKHISCTNSGYWCNLWLFPFG